MGTAFIKIKKFVTDKNMRFLYKSYLGFYDRTDDESFLTRKFKAILGYSPDLINPKSFNEKMNWLKLNYRNPDYTRLVDKYEVKQYVTDTLGQGFVIPNLGVWDDPDDIDFSSLPDSFVLKCTHDSGSRVICKNQSALDIKMTRKMLRKRLRNDYFLLNREWPYKNVRHRIIAEEYLENDGGCINDYRFYCFNGKPEFFSVDYYINGLPRVNFYDTDLNVLPFGSAEEIPDFNGEHKLPDNIKDMLEMARNLSKGHPFIRVDLYNIRGHIYFSELTFFTYGGFMLFYPDQSWDQKIGNMLDLSMIRV